MLAVKRLLAHGALFAALFGVVAGISGFSAGIAGYLDTSSTAGVRAGFATATGDDGALRAEVRAAGDEQDAAVREIVAASFAPAPMLVDRTVQSDPLGLDDRDEQLVLASLPIEERAELVDGSWAAAPDEAVLQADAADALDLAPGDTVRVAGGEFMVAGTWRAVDPLDPVWFGEELVATGTTGDAFGPLVVAETAYGEVVPFARWVIRPDPSAVDAGQLDAIADGAATLRDALSEDEAVGTGNVIFGGGLLQRTTALGGSVDALGGIAPVPALLVGAIGAITLVELARLLVGVRRIETGLLRSRGASAARLTAATALEAAAVAIPAAASGGAVALVLTGSASWPLVALVAAVAVAAFSLIVFLDSRRPASRESAQDSGRSRRVAGLGLLVLVTAAAIVSVWQFRLYGSPVIRAADGSTAVDPIAVLAPTAALVAAALLVVVLFAPASAAFERLAGRGRIGWALAGRQVARRTQVFLTPVLLIGLAVGGLVVAGTYSATWERATTTAREIGTGADVRVVTTETVDVPDEADAATPVLTATLQAADDAVQLVSMPAAAASAVLEPAGGAVDADAIAGALTASPSIRLPAGAVDLEVDATAPTTLWLVDDTGRVVAIDEPFEAPEGSWSIAGVDVIIDAPAQQYAYRLAGISVDGVALELGEWMLAEDATVLDDAEPPTIAQDGVGFDLRVGRPDPGVVRLVPVEAPAPLVVSDAFASRGGLRDGDVVTLRFEGSGRELSGVISSVIPVVPGTPSGLAVMVDLGAFDRQQLATSATSVPVPNELWISTDEPAAVAGALQRPGARVTTIEAGAGDVLLSAGGVALWIGALGGLALALAAAAAIVGALLSSRAGEVIVLRVVGVTPRQQAGSRRRELVLVLGFALVGGALVGALVSGLTVTQLARSAVVDPPEAVPTALLVDPVALPAVFAVFVLALALLVAGYGARVVRQARTLSVREDVR